MSYLQKQMDALKFDKRLLEMNRKKGVITEDEYQKHLKSLEDSTANSTHFEMEATPKEESNDPEPEAQGEAPPASIPLKN